MKLIAFDLDLPYVKNDGRLAILTKEHNCSIVEATKLDYQMNWKHIRRTFALQTRCISTLFERLLGGIDTKDCQKILVECVPSVSDISVKNFSGVYSVEVNFDAGTFAESNEFDKKRLTLSLLMDAIKKVAFDQNWDIAPFEDVYAKIIELEYKNEWTWKKCAKSPDKRYVANVLLSHEVSKIDISVIISNNHKTQVFREKVITELPDEYAYASHMGEINWVSNNEVILTNVDRDREWLVQFPG